VATVAVPRGVALVAPVAVPEMALVAPAAALLGVTIGWPLLVDVPAP
jgi:hypothetical protein